jgi:hypothetical protein
MFQGLPMACAMKTAALQAPRHFLRSAEAFHKFERNPGRALHIIIDGQES